MLPSARNSMVIGQPSIVAPLHVVPAREIALFGRGLRAGAANAGMAMKMARATMSSRRLIGHHLRWNLIFWRKPIDVNMKERFVHEMELP